MESTSEKLITEIFTDEHRRKPILEATKVFLRSADASYGIDNALQRTYGLLSTIDGIFKSEQVKS